MDETGLECFASKKEEIAQCQKEKGAFVDLVKQLDPKERSREAANETPANLSSDHAVCRYVYIIIQSNNL